MNPPFAVQKIGHAVLNVADLDKSKRFYTEVLGFKVSDIYPDKMMPGGMVFLRCTGCQVSVEFLDPDGHHLELYWGVDQIGYDGRARPAEEWRQTASLEDAVRIAPPGQDTTLHDAALRARLEAGT